MARSPDLVRRPRLEQHLSAGIRGRLTLVTAPAGSGKTVLLQQWLAHRAGADLPVAHIDLAAAGRGSRLVAALRAVTEGVLVLDGGDAVAERALADDVVALVDRAPARVHVVVASRSAWPAAHRRYTAADLTVLGEPELAFTGDEARAAVRACSGLDLSDRQAAALVGRTEGWAAGIRLAAVALRHAPEADPDEVIEGVGGEDRYVAGLLREAVLDRQPAPIRRFLTLTSVPDRLTGPLCDALTGGRDGARMLRRLEDLGLFTRHRADGSFAYHRLLRDLLRHELRRRHPELEPQLLVRAAAWHLGRDDPDTAARYLARAGDHDRLRRLVDSYGRAMFERGAPEVVLRWLDLLPRRSRTHQPEAALHRAFVHTMVGSTGRADQVLRDAGTASLTAGEAATADALRAAWVFFDGDPRSSLRSCDAVLDALEHLDPEDIPDLFHTTTPAALRAMALGSRARALWCLGDTAGSRQAFAALTSQPTAYPPWRAHALGALAVLEAWAGNLSLAQRHGRAAFDVARRAGLEHHPATIDARLAAAHVARERNQLDRADALLREAHALATRTRRPAALAIHAVERALWHLATGCPDQGLAEIEANRTGGHPSPAPVVLHRQLATSARLLLAAGDRDRAGAVLRGVPLSADPAIAAAAVAVAVGQDDLAAASAGLDAWPVGEPRARLERELWAAVVEAAGGFRRRASRRLLGLLARAEAEGHVRLFLDAGLPAEHLLHGLVKTQPTGYLRRLVRAAGQAPKPAADDLSDREREVARYLPTPLSNTEIAAQLYISMSTLKTHLRSIYRKLDVHGRDEAIVRVEDLGIA